MTDSILTCGATHYLVMNLTVHIWGGGGLCVMFVTVALPFPVLLQTKSVASGNSSLKWTDVPRLWKKRGTPSRTVDLDVIPVPDQLVMDAQELMSHHCSSIKPMSKYVAVSGSSPSPIAPTPW